MSDHKKYYYLKLKENFFESIEVMVLESMENGYKYSNLLLKLYLKSLEYEGELRFNECISYNEQIISAVTHIDIDTVRVALRLFKKLGFIEILDDGTIFMLDIQNFIGKSSTEAERKKNYRKKIIDEKIKLLSGETMDKSQDDLEIIMDKFKDDLEITTDKCPDDFGISEDISPPEIELEKEKEIEIEIEIEKDRAIPPAPYEKIKKLFNETCTKSPKIRLISANRKKHIQARYKQFDYDIKVFQEAFTKVNESEFCSGKNNRKWKVDFDWLIKNDENIVKVLEGKYDTKKRMDDDNESNQADTKECDQYTGIGIEL